MHRRHEIVYQKLTIGPSLVISNVLAARETINIKHESILTRCKTANYYFCKTVYDNAQLGIIRQPEGFLVNILDITSQTRDLFNYDNSNIIIMTFKC